MTTRGLPRLGRSVMPGLEPADERLLAEQSTGMPGLQVRHLQGLTMRVGEDETSTGEFDGYACVWDVRDSYGTSFRRGCFEQGGLDALAYALLWMHDPWVVYGLFYAAEDDHGLRINGRWDATPEGQAGRVKARSGSAPGLSVGFVPIGTDPDDPSVFTSCRLVETSQITARMAAVPGAEITGARSSAQRAAVDDSAAAAARLRLLGVTVTAAVGGA